jgi:HPt (histidine-containing phosphotransfer) domain-containing protein
MLKAGSQTFEYTSKKFPVSNRVMGGDSNASQPVLDLESTLTRLGGDRELFAELVGYLFEDLPRLFDDVRSAANAKDAAALRMNAHALKGLVAGCGGTRAAAVAQSLENAGQSFDLSQAAPLVQSLKTELDQLTRALEPYRR